MAHPSLLDRQERRGRLRNWFLEGLNDQAGSHQGPGAQPAEEHPRHPWWKVMCLTGVDYFSTLGYQPAIAALAAGFLSPMATIILIAVTLFGALPVYRRVAAESPHGAGSVAMLERLMPRWRGKVFVLVLLGFAATDFMITMTLSAADASAHLIGNPLAPSFLHGGQVWVTIVLLTLLAVVFLRGFAEAIGFAVVLVGVYLALNVVVVGTALLQVAAHPALLNHWVDAVTTVHGGGWAVLGTSLLVFPKLALGMSGFETGVAVMPQIRGSRSSSRSRSKAGSGSAAAGDDGLQGRIRGARRLLTTSAAIMSVFLLTSSFATTILIPPAEFQAGGQAEGRALAYVAHAYLGPVFASVYDLSTITILWFAGASAMAGLLNLVPRYLPRYGMAPEWASAVRPLIAVFFAAAVLVTVVFDADVNAQGGAYATGVLVLMTSAAVAVTLAVARRRTRRATIAFAAVTVVFVYTTVANVIERPEGVRIAAIFILAILVVSFVSRVMRSFELRETDVTFDEAALAMLKEANSPDGVTVIAHEAGHGGPGQYAEKLQEVTGRDHLPSGAHPLFLEVTVVDSSDFAVELDVRGIRVGDADVLRVTSPVVPNTIAAVLLQIRDLTDEVPHVYFEWTEGNPLTNLARFVFSGQGEVAPVTREILRRAEPMVLLRPHVHVG
ncbi:amino acid transporter [Tersicoccus sp. Bi-70]|uniref:amino acid transporter n=1 Tax=Tersicoccus sp. Bi-70 TaxID=1897634 RepID=UPI000978A4EF|nr:amino acid transporter [Tersicoccus sp. Bi-70]OMH36625.1 amino acid transporter [Tersicoccus sp. Bi-70]